MAIKSTTTLTVGKSGYALGQHRTEEQWDEVMNLNKILTQFAIP